MIPPGRRLDRGLEGASATHRTTGWSWPLLLIVLYKKHL